MKPLPTSSSFAIVPCVHVCVCACVGHTHTHIHAYAHLANFEWSSKMLARNAAAAAAVSLIKCQVR